ncbi:LysR family transcriptional regulator (plasmid) [Pantoea sp. C3]|uniref:LysR family transcriptional regulator n=1 Tax=Pantoea phytostimulans TaxID=2769024 RepID=UPI0038F7564D
MEIKNIDDILAFVAVAKAGSFTSAGKVLGLTRSAVGKRISRLEERLNIRLFQRTTRSLSMTDEGELFYARCVPLLEELREAEQMLTSRNTLPRGRLKLTMPVTLGQMYGTELVNDYLYKWPEVGIDTVFTDRYVDLTHEAFDVAIRIGEPDRESRLLSRAICQHRTITCATPEYLENMGKPENIADLKKHSCIHFSYDGKVLPWRYKTAGKSITFSGSGRITADNAVVLLQGVYAHIGIAQLPLYLVSDSLRSGLLIQVIESAQEVSQSINVVYPSKRQLSPKVRQFIDHVIAAWSPVAPWEKVVHDML